ncbi:ABC transporter ATP-binding protein [Palleronia sp.]|uniref:ABC transporter ATP-binding protein n=1 Tax=Palleronia sp. TaxID=1940284 RepID=UPI0035C86872
MAGDGLPLAIEGLEVRSAENRVLLSVPRLELPAGGTMGIRGPSGAGKSTLLFALAGLQDRMTGRVQWGDTDLGALRSGARTAFRARHVGIVFQDFLLFEELGPVANASLAAMYRPRGERSGIRDRARRLLKRFGIDEDGRTVPTLSGGERQRVAVARAMSGDAAILLADEPTANLDRDTGERLLTDLLARVRENGTTLVAVSHDDRLLARMDRVVKIVDGQMVSAHA